MSEFPERLKAAGEKETEAVCVVGALWAEFRCYTPV